MTKKRKLFDELMDGIDAMRRQREDKITLCSKEVCRIMCVNDRPYGAIPGSP